MAVTLIDLLIVFNSIVVFLGSGLGAGVVCCENSSFSSRVSWEATGLPRPLSHRSRHLPAAHASSPGLPADPMACHTTIPTRITGRISSCPRTDPAPPATQTRALDPLSFRTSVLARRGVPCLSTTARRFTCASWQHMRCRPRGRRTGAWQPRRPRRRCVCSTWAA